MYASVFSMKLQVVGMQTITNYMTMPGGLTTLMVIQICRLCSLTLLVPDSCLINLLFQFLIPDFESRYLSPLCL